MRNFVATKRWLDERSAMRYSHVVAYEEWITLIYALRPVENPSKCTLKKRNRLNIASRSQELAASILKDTEMFQ